MIDYQEAASDFPVASAYMGPMNSFWVNETVFSSLYKFTLYVDQRTDWGGYKLWSADVKLSRPRYPTFGTQSDIYSSYNRQLFPHPSVTTFNDTQAPDCRLYEDRYGTQPYAGDFFNNGYCVSSCYTPEQRVLFPGGYSPIIEAVSSLREEVMTLTPSAKLDDIQLQTGRVYSYISEFRDSDHPIVELSTASGGLLRLTVEHPVVNSEGRLVKAEQLKVGDDLLRVDGSRDPIIQVKKMTHSGKVYNLRPTSMDRVSNVLVAEGYLVGSALFQNEEVDYLNRIILHKSLAPELIP